MAGSHRPRGSPDRLTGVPDGDAARTDPAMKLLHTVIGPIATNLYVLGDEASREAIAVDTARPCVAWLTSALAEQGWTLKLVVSSHRHWDHIGDNAAVVAETGALIAVHPLDPRRPRAPAPPCRPPSRFRRRFPPSSCRRRPGPVRRDRARGAPHAGSHRRLGLSARAREPDCCSAETRCSRAGGGESTCRADRPSRWSRHFAACAASMDAPGTARPRSGHDDRARA